MKYLLVLLLAGCGVRHRTTTYVVWISARGNSVTFKGNWLTYKENNCHITGKYEKTHDNYLIWNILENTCADIDTPTSCYFAKNSYGEHGNFVCKDLDIKETFYRIKNDNQPK